MTTHAPTRPLRSALYVPGDRPRAMQKAESLGSDALVFDLEDAVAADAKDQAREAIRDHFAAVRSSRALRVIRINGLDTLWGTEDLLAARAAQPDAILIPKVDTPEALMGVADALAETDAPDTLRLWAMIETPLGVINAAAIAALRLSGRVGLDCLVVGTNDLFKETGLSGTSARDHGHPWLMQIVLAARAGRIAALDGVFNDHSDIEGCKAECRQGAAMGFDGKTLIHPSQVAPANAAFAPDAEAVARAKRLVAAFAQPEHEGRGVITFEGAMAERLHLIEAEALLARAAAAEQTDHACKGESNADEGLSNADRTG